MTEAERLRQDWDMNPRWRGVVRNYLPEQVVRLRSIVQEEYSLARFSAGQLWDLFVTEPYVKALGAYTGMMAVQMVAAGLKAIYLSGWQVAGDANDAGETYPDQSLYPADSVPNVARRINNALRREQEKQRLANRSNRNWLVPIVADAEAGFGGNLNAFELMKKMIQAGVAAVHFEDQLAAEKKCGHLGGKVLVSTGSFIRTLTAARLATDVLDVPTILIARTDANGAYLLNNDSDDRDKPFLTGERTSEGFYRMRGGLDCAIARALAYAPYADLLWFETAKPSLEEAKKFAEAVHAKYPGKFLAYNLSPSFNWSKNLDKETIKNFQQDLANLGYKFQFVTLAGFHALNLAMFKMARDYAQEGMAGYVRLQDEEFALEKEGYAAVRHQEMVGTGYFDEVAKTISGGEGSTSAMEGSTEQEQFR